MKLELNNDVNFLIKSFINESELVKCPLTRLK